MEKFALVLAHWWPTIDKTVRLLAASSLLCLLGGATHGQTKVPQDGQRALKVLESLEPKTSWRPETLLKGDFDCDGSKDYAFGGQKANRYIIGILKGPVKANSKHWVISFKSGKESQNSLCSLDARINLESRKDLKTRHKCKGIKLHDDLCDSFHIYWKKLMGRFVWSRL